MTAKNQEYADLWDRLMDNQQRRKAEAAPERAIEIIYAQRERDWRNAISDPDALLRMYGDRDTRISPSPAVKLYDVGYLRPQRVSCEFLCPYTANFLVLTEKHMTVCCAQDLQNHPDTTAVIAADSLR